MTVTRADVAARAGTSTAVVSYVVNNGPRQVRPATRAKVQQAIDELCYRPNAIARALRTRQSRTIGLVMPARRNSYYVDLTTAIEDAARLRQHVVVTAHLTGDADRDADHLRLLGERGIDAFILMADPVSEEYAKAFAEAGIRGYILDAADPDVDNFSASAAATQHLLDHGYRRIDYLGGPPELKLGQARRSGWSSTLRTAGIEIQREAAADFTRRAGYEAARAMLTGNDLPRAILTFNDEQAIGVMRAAWDLDLRVPADLALFGFDATYDGDFTTPPLSSVSVPVDALAVRLVDRVLRESDGDEDEQPTPLPVLPFDLRLRGSCGCMPDDSHPPNR